MSILERVFRPKVKTTPVPYATYYVAYEYYLERAERLARERVGEKATENTQTICWEDGISVQFLSRTGDVTGWQHIQAADLED